MYFGLANTPPPLLPHIKIFVTLSYKQQQLLPTIFTIPVTVVKYIHIQHY